ncbi:hypothetical protein [Lentibacter algarum]|uniref:hypothetical protein n=1 Tax=Lentibacter algarum TaxID=576131 RepID=UPI0026EBA2A4|nr:hypothetical protein [Lentibacter algarum]
MTVIVSKPAVNLREELASLRNQGGYSEQQFWLDGLVTNGTFDTDTTGWTAVDAQSVLSVDTQRMKVLNGDASQAAATQAITTEVGKTYQATFTVTPNEGNPIVRLGTAVNGPQYHSVAYSTESTVSFLFVATTATTYWTLYVGSSTSGHSAYFDNVSVYETDGTDVVHRMPKGWAPKDVYEDGLLQREGSAHDYEVVYDGFDYFVKPTVAPSATTQTCVIGVKA